MRIEKILDHLKDVKPYDKGNATMWTDPYISKQLLQMHLNTAINVASRKEENIDKTIKWLTKDFETNNKTILDLGCGPGIYTHKLAALGHSVTGIDFSKVAIDHAKKRAKADQLEINYINDNYLSHAYVAQYDLILMIYCDFGVLSLDERKTLIENIYGALKPGGHFIFDALNEKNIEKLDFKRTWDLSEGGFWQEESYICLSDALHFESHKATLDQHLVLSKDDTFKLYRFWNHYFNEGEIEALFKAHGFSALKSFENLICDHTPYNDEGVTFYRIKK